MCVSVCTCMRVCMCVCYVAMMRLQCLYETLLQISIYSIICIVLFRKFLVIRLHYALFNSWNNG